ncbi:putative zinc protease [Indibacter alkaliphilus LW1]|uniref:Zinc protease n=1 Tax=Indibacter alkaliphilus (strain CCUG 57479 / KCTC 22604 / LW1) TaxID=1189612 RepID=S2DH58_INDAL|nr:pitrilysin family protein [Indibacter alkaliphilus]EOZ96460.1 putative zinc protease [Indibacter alkaliphilus LW1]
MINYQKIVLQNGLVVLVHEDPSSKIAVVNLLYKVGSRNEIPGKTGLAHFFEHLMFGSSKNVPVFDAALEKVGGSCNAFTNTDITNYYITLPAVNLETAFWLESDRMFQLNLSEKTIETQRKVVIEEYKQRYLNQPYGDVFHHLRDLAFDTHPYKWPTIGKEIEDIVNYKRLDIEEFYLSHYSPDNAVLVVAGGIKAEEVKYLAEKWFADIPSSHIPKKTVPQELPQTSKKAKTVMADVPTDALYKAFHMPAKLKDGYLESDLITDIIGFGRSSLLEQRLVKNGHIFASVGAYILGTVDPGLMVFSGKMEKGQSAEKAEKVLDDLILEFLQSTIEDRMLTKVKNQAEAMKTYESVQLLNRAMSLAYYAHLGNPDLYQTEYEKKTQIPSTQIMEWANAILKEENSSVLYYKSKGE